MGLPCASVTASLMSSYAGTVLVVPSALPHVGVTVMETLFTTRMAAATVLPSIWAEKR